MCKLRVLFLGVFDLYSLVSWVEWMWVFMFCCRGICGMLFGIFFICCLMISFCLISFKGFGFFCVKIVRVVFFMVLMFVIGWLCMFVRVWVSWVVLIVCVVFVLKFLFFSKLVICVI